MTPVTAEEPVTRAGARTILVVEDEAFIRFHVAASLKDHGFNVLEASTAAEALELFATHAPVHLVFTDVTLPGGLTGFDLVQELAGRDPGLPVIFTSGRHNEPAARQIYPSARFFSKPYDIVEVINCIDMRLGS
jgi:DNA-binding NtrC family response regulator